MVDTLAVKAACSGGYMKVLVTNGNSRMALCIARDLNKKGHEVVVGDYMKNYMCSFSNKVSEDFIYPSPYSKPEEFIECIKQKIMQLKIDSIIPIHEETFLISKRQHELKDIVSLSVPNYESILSVHNKDLLYELLTLQSINTPKTLYLKDFNEFENVRDIFDGRIVLKPKQGGGNWGLFFPDVEKSYKVQIENYLKTTKVDISRVLVQEWIPTKEKFSHVVIYQHGKLIQDFADIHIRDFPISGGSGVLRRSCASSPMTEISKKLFDAIGWNGIAEVEYVKHAETGEYYLIEVNPRVWGGINSAISSGLDIIGMMLDISKNIQVNPSRYVIGTQTRWFWGDLRVFPEYYRKSKNKFSAINDYMKLIFDGTNTDEFYWDDILPFFVWPYHVVSKMIKNKSLKPTTYDSLSGEWE